VAGLSRNEWPDSPECAAELLNRVVESLQITVTDLTAADVLPVPDEAREPLPKLSRPKMNGPKPDALFG
jgi:hypothetical protein